MRWPPESWPWPRSLALLAVIFVVYIVTVLVAVAAATAFQWLSMPFDGPKNAPVLIALQGVSYLPFIAVAAFGLPLASRLPLREIGFRAPRGRDVAIAVIGAFAMYAVVYVISFVVDLTGTKAPEQSVELFKHLTSFGDRALFIAVACVFAPISEELFFRVLIFSSVRRYAPTAVAAAISAVLFGAMHMAPGSPAEIVPQLLAVALPLVGGGFVLAYVYEISGCYWSNVLTHALFNTASVVGILVLHLK